MNLPNKLTVARMVLIPVFLGFMYLPKSVWSYSIALVIFALASATDWLDGYLARKQGLVTDFGKLMDPLADKLLVLSAMICFIELKIVPGIAVFVILAREFLVTSVRLIAASKGTVIAADIWGKLKTVFQMAWILWGLMMLAWLAGVSADKIPAAVPMVYMVLLCVVVLLTVLSGVNYVWKNRELFADCK